MSNISLRPAQRSKAKLRIGLSGPSGSGKTYSALLIASGIASDWSKIAIIDTENGSGELYSDLGPYNVITLLPSEGFSPERYIEAITACEAAGMEVVIIDSITHEWDGKGGCLEINDKTARAKYKGNTWSAWSDTTPRHQHFIDAIVQSRCHIITTVRNKQDTVQVEGGKVKKVGTKEVTREGYEYELTVNLNLDRDGNLAIASKDRTRIFAAMDPFVPTVDTGKLLAEWAAEGKEPPAPPAPPAPATEDQKKLLKKYVIDNVEEAKQPGALAAIAKMNYDVAAAKIAEHGLKSDDAPPAPAAGTDAAGEVFGDNVRTAKTTEEVHKDDALVAAPDGTVKKAGRTKAEISTHIDKLTAIQKKYNPNSTNFKDMAAKIAELEIELTNAQS